MKLEGNLKNLCIVVIISWIVLAIIFGFTDLQISIALLNRDAIWANIGKDFGEGPGYGIIAISIAILIGSKNDDLKKQRIASYVILIIGLVFLTIALIFANLWFITFGGGIAIPMIIFLIFTKNRDFKEYTTIATVIILLAIINPLIFVQITKIMCGRVRFNDLSPGYANYTPWFLPPGPISGLKGNASFPSGHTAMGWMFLPLIFSVRDRKWTNPIKIIVIILIIVFGLFLGVSRIVTGDHFASDVLFSTGVAAIATIWLYHRYYIKK
ncbi:MAG: phosphatase PAP2 family protein [Promethearchaeota archaeon]|nr:MAG: phosphatase PAP2 family protein [Candidatus Lokiarchaeota archaeon]